MIPAKPAKIDVLDKGDLLIVRKLLKIGGGQEIPAYGLIRQISPLGFPYRYLQFREFGVRRDYRMNAARRQ